MELSPLAQSLLNRMQGSPNQLRYDTGVLGAMFRPDDLARLDDAYRELESSGLIEKSGATVSFFGKPKSIFRLTSQGRSEVGAQA